MVLLYLGLGIYGRKGGRKEGRKEVGTGGRQRKRLGGLHIHSLGIRDRVRDGSPRRRNGSVPWIRILDLAMALVLGGELSMKRVPPRIIS